MDVKGKEVELKVDVMVKEVIEWDEEEAKEEAVIGVRRRYLNRIRRGSGVGGHGCVEGGCCEGGHGGDVMRRRRRRRL